MKQSITNLINQQNRLLNGALIYQPADEYVEKIIKNANIVTHSILGQLAGFIAYYCNDPGYEVAFLTMLCVAPEYTGKGTGRRLLHYSINDISLKGFSRYELEVKETNLPAIQLYKSAGFEITAIVDDKLKMTKAIIHEG